MKEEIEQLALSLNSYATYLDKASDKQTLRQSQSAPVRQVDTHLSIKYISKVESVGSVYNRLDLAMSEIDEFEPLFFDEDIHLSEGFAFKSYEQRYKYLSDLALSSDIHLLHYDPGGSLGAVCFMWKISSNMSSEEVFVADTQILSGLRLKLPEFHTRKMRKDFATAYENIAGITIPPHVLRSIYTTLTNDATSYQNPELDQRMRLAVLGSEPDLVVDMRHLNKGRPGNTFDQFFDVLEKEVESFVAADERRHNVEHISQYLSVRDLIEQVKQKLPDDTPIPSEATVLLAFVPKNSHAKVSKLYKGRVPLRLKVQTRQLRASHADDHYCAALFKYMKQYAVKHRDEIKFVCMDDKSKIDFGEPGMFSSSGVRGKKSIVPMNSSLSCLDHDVQSKGSLTPSVVLDVDIPNSVEETFYQGEVSLTMKDSVFQPSNPFRHVVELKNILDKKEEKKPVLFMYTDGGPDHKVTFHSVKLSLIVLFKKMGLEFLVACRTAPGHSWANPAERIMSVLNIAFQNTALAREEMNSEMEQNLRSCSGMNDIRKKAEKIEGLKGAWLDSLTSVENLLEDRVKRLQLKGKQFCTHPPASDDILEQAEAEVTLIDNTISVGKYQQQQVSRADRYKKFLGK